MQYRFNPAEPADYAEWGRLVGAFARHLVDHYGIREVRTWPPEVWNEPNLPRIRRIAHHADPYREWVELGSPEYPTRRQLRPSRRLPSSWRNR